MFDSKKLKFADLFNFSIVSKRFYYVSRVDKKFVSAMRFSKRIVNFNPDYLKFLKDELKRLGKDIREKFNEKFVKRPYVFGLVDVMLEKIAYGLLPFKIFCHFFYCQRRNKTAGK